MEWWCFMGKLLIQLTKQVANTSWAEIRNTIYGILLSDWSIEKAI